MKCKLAICIICLAFILTSCTNASNANIDVTQESVKPSQAEEVKVTPTSGGTLNVAIRNPKTLNPLLNEDESIDEILKLIYDSLISLDENQKPVSYIAESWQFSPDGMSLTVKLRNDIIWHNANKLTSKDIIFSLDTIKKSQPTSAYKACIDNIVSYSAVDDYAVSIVYNKPFSAAVYALNFPIISSEYYGDEDILTSKKNMQPIGTGAYEFVNFDTMKEMNLKKNGLWFKGNPYIDNIKAIVIPKKSAELFAFDEGQIDLLSTDVVDWKKYSETKEREYISNYYDFVGVNFNNGMLNDKLVRQALAYAIPRNKIIEEVYLDHAILTDTPINPKSWLNSNKELLYNYDTNKSKELLKQAGWEDSDQNGILEKEGIEFRLSLLVNEENLQRLAVANIIKEALKQINIELNVDIQNYEVYVQKLTSKEFDCFLGGWKFSLIPNFNFAFHSSQITAGSNYISYSNPNMDSLLEQTSLSIGDEALIEAYKNLGAYMIDDLPYISLYFRDEAVLLNERVLGEISSDMNNVYLGIENCFIDNK